MTTHLYSCLAGRHILCRGGGWRRGKLHMVELYVHAYSGVCVHKQYKKAGGGIEVEAQTTSNRPIACIIPYIFISLYQSVMQQIHSRRPPFLLASCSISFLFAWISLICKKRSNRTLPSIIGSETWQSHMTSMLYKLRAALEIST